MKKNILLPGLAILLCVFWGCQKEVSFEKGNASGAVTGDFRAKINGVQWVANKAATAVRTSNGIINLTGASTDGKIITITLFDSGVHVYTLDDQVFGAGAYSESSNGSSVAFSTNASGDTAMAGGSCTITSIDTVKKNMSGTFKFKVFRPIDTLSKNITEGSFTNLSYNTNTAPPPTSSTDTFRVKLDGVDWKNYSVIGLAVPTYNKIAITSNYDVNGSKNIGFQLDNTITVGSYVFDLFDVVGVYNPTNSLTNPTPYLADGGNLTILEHNTTTKRIRGTFNFVAKPFLGTTGSINFTEGYFSVKYQ